NPRYIAKYRKHLKAELRAAGKAPSGPSDVMSVDAFQKLIINLRTLKFARLLYRAAVKKVGRKHVSRVLVRPLKKKTLPKHKICSAEVVLVTTPAARGRVEKLVRREAAIPPLSKYGVDAEFKFVTSANDIPDAYKL